MHGIFISVAINCHSPYSHFLCCFHHTTSNLTSVGYDNLLDRSWTCKTGKSNPHCSKIEVLTLVTNYYTFLFMPVLKIWWYIKKINIQVDLDEIFHSHTKIDTFNKYCVGIQMTYMYMYWDRITKGLGTDFHYSYLLGIS